MLFAHKHSLRNGSPQTGIIFSNHAFFFCYLLKVPLTSSLRGTLAKTHKTSFPHYSLTNHAHSLNLRHTSLTVVTQQCHVHPSPFDHTLLVFFKHQNSSKNKNISRPATISTLTRTHAPRRSSETADPPRTPRLARSPSRRSDSPQRRIRPSEWPPEPCRSCPRRRTPT